MDFFLPTDSSVIENVPNAVRFQSRFDKVFPPSQLLVNCNFDSGNYMAQFKKKRNTTTQANEFLIFDKLTNDLNYPILIQTKEDAEVFSSNSKTIIYFGSSQQKPGTRVFPLDSLFRTLKTDTFVLTGLPDRVDYGALGTYELKFENFWHECKDNSEENCGPFEIDEYTNQQWNKTQCHEIKNLRLCELCFLQFFMLDAKKGKVIDRCQNGQSPNGLSVIKCTNECPRIRFMPNETKWSRQKYEEVFSGYTLCQSARKVTDYCHMNGTMKYYDDSQSSGLLTPDTSGTIFLFFYLRDENSADLNYEDNSNKTWKLKCVFIKMGWLYRKNDKENIY